MVRRDPVGVVASIAPWNYPLLHGGLEARARARDREHRRRSSPSVRTPLSALRFAELGRRAPPARRPERPLGLRQRRSATLVEPPEVRMVSITGDTVTGKHIAESRPAPSSALHLELGGKAPVIVFDDADVELDGRGDQARPATGTAARTARRPAASSPARPSTTSFVDRPRPTQVKSIKWGNPADADDPRHGLADRPRRRPTRSKAWSTARLEAKAEPRRRRPPSGPGPGAYFEPTVIANPRPGQRDRPGRGLRPRRHRPALLETRSRRSQWANDVKFGLAVVGVHGLVSKAMRTAAPLQFGTVGSTSTSRSRRRPRTAASRSRATARTARSTRSRTTRP